KVHKNPIKWRPITGMHSGPTTNLSTTLAKILREWHNRFADKLFSFFTPLRDTFQLLSKLYSLKTIDFAEFQFIATGDFSSLYTRFTNNEIFTSMTYLNSIIPLPVFFNIDFNIFLKLLTICLEE